MNRPSTSAAPLAKPVYFNRDLSWIEFNARVLDEALDSSTPLLDRLKFLAIVNANFDEFFMVRVATLKRQLAEGDKVSCPAGLRASELLPRIARRVKALVERQYQCFLQEVKPRLKREGLVLMEASDYNPAQAVHASELFDREIFHTLTPVAITADSPLPLSGNLRQYAAFVLEPMQPAGAPGQVPAGGLTQRLAMVQIPPGLERLRLLPGADGQYFYALLEDIIIHNAHKLFPGHVVREHLLFLVTRDADLGVDEEREDDFVEAMAEIVAGRDHTLPIRMTMRGNSPVLRELIQRKLGLDQDCVYELPGPLGLRNFMELVFHPAYEHLRDKVGKPSQPRDLPDDSNIFAVLKEHDILLHHPYESFEHVVNLVNTAADDPAVLAIKMTLYRAGGKSPIVRALARAAENNKQVTALVELKARFDEGQNIEWARQLEQAGVLVIYGIANLKVHAKALLIVRRETQGIMRYLHLGTGNYNDRTAKLYTDFSLLTCRDDLAFEAALFFNAITGCSTAPALRHLAMAPFGLRGRLTQLVEREISRHESHGGGLIMAKMNSLACPEMIALFYRASQHGVKVMLNVRGICCLVPGVAGLSENITVISVVDRYLEHSRIYYFRNSESPEEIYLASADLMTRNLDRRIELMFPVPGGPQKKRLIGVLNAFFKDNVKARVLLPDGSYQRVVRRQGSKSYRVQNELQREARLRAESEKRTQSHELVVRRKPPRTRQTPPRPIA